MAKNIEEILSESVSLSDEARTQITETWNERISEAREEIAAVLREEFARKFEHDKNVLVESIDRFLTDKIRIELEEFAIDKRELVAERTNYKRKVKEHAQMLDKFISENLANEMKVLRADKKAMSENFKKLENFVLKQLSDEIHEFRQDKKSLVEQKVRMVSEGKRKLHETKQVFIQRAAKIVDENIEQVLRHEISQFKNDIKVARENEFGRRIFEAFGPEFMTSFLNESVEIKKMQKVLASKDQELGQLRESVKANSKLVEGLDTKLKATQNLVERQKVMAELLAPLSKDKKVVMKQLLETVQTINLRGAYKKYLPSVLNEASVTLSKTQLNEQVMSVKTGDRAVVALNESADDDEFQSELAQMRNLAGLSK